MAYGGLPAIMCLKSVYNNKYLRYRDGGVQTHGLLQFSGETALDLLAQFEMIVPSRAVDNLVHLKSRYTNKFLVRWSPNSYWITASADKPNEDQTSWGCTLFQPSVSKEGQTLTASLIHVQLGHFARLALSGTDPFDSCLIADSKYPDQDARDIFNVKDWASISQLPRRVAFKGDNGKYLGSYVSNNGHGKNLLKFSYDNLDDWKVEQEIITFPEGVVYIKSKHYNKYWRLGDNDWIVADVDDAPGSRDPATMFRPNVLDINLVALLNMSKTWYCKRYSGRGEGDSLSVITESVDEYTPLHVVDLGP